VVAAALGGLDADVVVDAGRLLPNFAGGSREILEHSDALVVVCDPTLEGIVHLRAALPALLAEIRDPQLLIVPTAAGTYEGSEIAATLGVSVGPPMPHDRKAADALANRRSVARLERTALFKWASALARDLGIEALTGEPLDSEVLETGASDNEEASHQGGDPTDPADQPELHSPADDEGLVSATTSGQASPNHFEVSAPVADASASWDHADEALAVGAGSSGKAQP
jgi:hypothetical protein